MGEIADHDPDGVGGTCAASPGRRLGHGSSRRIDADDLRAGSAMDCQRGAADPAAQVEQAVAASRAEGRHEDVEVVRREVAVDGRSVGERGEVEEPASRRRADEQPVRDLEVESGETRDEASCHLGPGD